jgi:hypothetical protein
MSYNDPTDPVDGITAVDAAWAKVIDDDIRYEANGRPVAYLQYVTGTDITNLAQTTWTAIDSTNIKVSFTNATVSGGVRLACFATFNFANPTNQNTCFDFWLDGATQSGSANTNGIARVPHGTSASVEWFVTLNGNFSGVAGGSHNIQIYFKNSGAGNASVYLTNCPLILRVWEY